MERVGDNGNLNTVLKTGKLSRVYVKPVTFLSTSSGSRKNWAEGNKKSP